MYEIKVDTQKNRLYVILKGFMDQEEAKNAANEVTRQSMLLTPGFDILTDISEFSPVSPEAAEEVKRAQGMLFRRGAKRVVRVVKNVLSSMQFKRTQKEAGAKYEVLTAASVEEAEQMLDTLNS